jgi:hypothetical protein
MNKRHLEFHPVDMNEVWHTRPVIPPGSSKRFSRAISTRPGRWAAAAEVRSRDYTTVPFVHDHREEVHLMSGDLIVGNDASLPRTLRRRQHMNLAS